MAKHTLKNRTKCTYHHASTQSKAEIMLIIVLFHDLGYQCLKHFYQGKVYKHMLHLFPKVVYYNSFVELEKEVTILLTLFIKKLLLGKSSGISFVDSTPLWVCKNQRINIHKTFKGIAQKGKCSIGWFFGFKLHLICNEREELLNFMITLGDMYNRKPLDVEIIYGKFFGDKGYIGKNLFERLFVDEIQLTTKLKSIDVRLGRTAPQETGNYRIRQRRTQNIAQVEHSRHRTFESSTFWVQLLLSEEAVYQCYRND